MSTSDKNGAEKAGQLLEDLSNFIRKVDDDVYPSEAYTGYKWVFTPDMIPNSRKLHDVPSDALIKEYEEKLLKHTIERLKKDEKALKTLIEKTGQDSSKFDQFELDEYLDDLAEELSEAKFFEITKFKHIVKSND